MNRFVRLALAAALFAAPLSFAAAAEESVTYRNLLTPLLATGTTVIDQSIAYPGGTPKITAAVVVIPPGGETGWHVHRVPLFTYILEGEVTVDYGERGLKVFKAGDTMLEAMNWPHNGMNRSDRPVHILAVYMGAEGAPNAEQVAAPN
jgi:quercetin dioxygenase-like cupin family protein